MVGEIGPLRGLETVNSPVGWCLLEAGIVHERVEAKASQVAAIDPGGYENLALILEADEPAGKEVVGIRGEQQPVHPIEPLLSRLAGTPRLYVTRLQQGGVRDAGEAAF